MFVLKLVLIISVICFFTVHAAAKPRGGVEALPNRNLKPPCAKGQWRHCDRSRIKKCGTITTGFTRTFSTGTDCTRKGHIDPYVSEIVLVQFTGSDGCQEILVQPGECWGEHPFNGGVYNCQGRCGASCATGVFCSNWAADCLRHDVCSWYYGATGGRNDPNCGDEFYAAVEDTTRACTGPRGGPCEASYDDADASSRMYLCPAEIE